MDKKKLYELAEDKASEETIERFDAVLNKGIIRSPKSDFTDRVMRAIAQPNAKRSSFWHMWMIVAGVVVAMMLWAMEGFSLPQLSLSIELPAVSQVVDLPQVNTIDMTNMTMIFMSVNGLLVLFLIDRWYQYRKHAQ